MLSIHCTTTIDCAKRLEWPTFLPDRPLVGDLIRSLSSTDKKVIELEVVRCTWSYGNLYSSMGDWHLEVELWLVRSRFENVDAFEKWVEGQP